MSFREAVDADRAGLIEKAAAEYEDAVHDGDHSLRTLLNLALLYWQATDPGIAAAEHLRPEFLARAGARWPELLDQARSRYPASIEVEFWNRYIAWAELGEPIDIETCRQMLRQDPDVPLPALWIFAETEGNEASSEANELLRRARVDGTAGARYVISVIESVLMRSRWQGRSD